MIVAHCEGVGVPGRAKRIARESFLDVVCGDDRMIGPYLRSGAVGALNAVATSYPVRYARLSTLRFPRSAARGTPTPASAHSRRSWTHFEPPRTRSPSRSPSRF